MKIILTRTVLILALVMMLSGSLVTYAATTLFTQTFPAETFATASLNVGSKCSGGDLVLVPADSTVPNSAGQYAALEFACDSTGDAAFTSTWDDKYYCDSHSDIYSSKWVEFLCRSTEFSHHNCLLKRGV